MSDYVPTTENVRHAYADFHYPVVSVSHAIGLVEFDDWLAQVRAEARRDALREAALSLEWFADDPNRNSLDASALSEGVEYLRALADKETP